MIHFLTIVPASLYPDEDKVNLSKFLLNLLLIKEKCIGELKNLSPAYLFPAIICSDNPRPLKNCFFALCETIYPQYSKYWKSIKFVRDVFHILNRLRGFLDKNHSDWKYKKYFVFLFSIFFNINFFSKFFLYSFQDFSDIYRLLRKPRNTLTLDLKYKQHIEDEYLQFKSFIIRLFRNEIDYCHELGTIRKLIILLDNSKWLAQWYLGTTLSPFKLNHKLEYQTTYGKLKLHNKMYLGKSIYLRLLQLLLNGQISNFNYCIWSISIESKEELKLFMRMWQIFYSFKWNSQNKELYDELIIKDSKYLISEIKKNKEYDTNEEKEYK